MSAVGAAGQRAAGMVMRSRGAGRRMVGEVRCSRHQFDRAGPGWAHAQLLECLRQPQRETRHM